MRSARMILATAAASTVLVLGAPGAYAAAGGDWDQSDSSSYSKEQDKEQGKEHDKGSDHDRPHGGMHTGGGWMASGGGSGLAAGSVLLLGGVGAGAFVLRRRRGAGAVA